MPFDAKLKSAMANMPGCIFAGVTDLEQGLMIGFSPAAALDAQEVENLAAMAVGYLESAPAKSIATGLHPKGKAAICHFVPRRSTRDHITGPKPSEKTSAWMPHQRPTM